MDMQLYTLHVVPFTLIVYGGFLLFLRPPREVIIATLTGGLVMAFLSALADVIAISASWWYYNASGLVLQLPLPLYTAPVFIFGGLAYLLIWRYWYSGWHWLAVLLLVGVPLLGFGRDLLEATVTHASYITWRSPIAGGVDFLAWLMAFYAGFWVFRRLAPERKQVEVPPTAA